MYLTMPNMAAQLTIFCYCECLVFNLVCACVCTHACAGPCWQSCTHDDLNFITADIRNTIASECVILTLYT